MSEVSVDRDFVRVGDKSFAINKINSVEVRTRLIKGEIGWIFLWLLAGLFGIVALAGIGDPDDQAPIGFFFFLAAALGYRSWRKRGDKKEYQLFLVTSSGEAAAMKTEDREAVMKTRHDIESAMAGR